MLLWLNLKGRYLNIVCSESGLKTWCSIKLKIRSISVKNRCLVESCRAIKRLPLLILIVRRASLLIRLD